MKAEPLQGWVLVAPDRLAVEDGGVIVPKTRLSPNLGVLIAGEACDGVRAGDRVIFDGRRAIQIKQGESVLLAVPGDDIVGLVTQDSPENADND